ncbi:NOP protein chaperone 1 [Odontesthes bonariensis]|uniref:NOP protein chaperone 1 n=1 Tax=Odontesthes bonariensis TaxID=219752 RepID=UPI003F5816A8
MLISSYACWGKSSCAFLKMELDTKKTSSQALLSCGSGGDLSEKLLLKPKAGRSLQTERVPRSSVLERLQNFLPQMAEANEKLKQQIDEAPAGRFDIECVEEAERVIEMDVALVELDGSDSSSEDDEETSDSETDNSGVTEETLKLPGRKGKTKKANIQVLEQQRE